MNNMNNFWFDNRQRIHIIRWEEIYEDGKIIERERIYNKRKKVPNVEISHIRSLIRQIERQVTQQQERLKTQNLDPSTRWRVKEYIYEEKVKRKKFKNKLEILSRI